MRAWAATFTQLGGLQSVVLDESGVEASQAGKTGSRYHVPWTGKRLSVNRALASSETERVYRYCSGVTPCSAEDAPQVPAE